MPHMLIDNNDQAASVTLMFVKTLSLSNDLFSYAGNSYWFLPPTYNATL